MVPLELRLPQQLRCALTCILAYGDSVSADRALRRGANSRLAVAASQRRMAATQRPSSPVFPVKVSTPPEQLQRTELALERLI